MNLREEIKDILHRYGDFIYDEEFDKPLDEILKLIEKRIDEIKQEYPTPTLINDYSGNRYVMLCGIQEFYDKLKEMLK